MTLQEYVDQFLQFVEAGAAYGVTSQVAAELAAGYEIGLSVEQMRRFLARRTEITSVAVALKSHTLSVRDIERILEARRSGAVYPKDVLAQVFMPEEVHEKFLTAVFGERNV